MRLHCVSVVLQGQQLRKHIDATLGSGNLREAVRLPPGEDLNEWLAVNSEPPPLLFPLFLLCMLLIVHSSLFTVHSQPLVESARQTGSYVLRSS